MAEKVTIQNIPQVAAELRRAFSSGRTRDIAWRKQQLKKLKEMIVLNKDVIVQAVQQDLGKKNPFEVVATEINLVVAEIEENLHHVDEWVQPEKVYTPVAAQPAQSFVYHDPKGVVLIMSPWNYPVNLALVPLAGAITAGNAALLKLSRHSANVARVVGGLLPKYMDNECIRVENEGGADMITALIKEKWDHIFFTGSVSVGRIVYQAAAQHLTPVTLELGGKNPCILDKDTDIELSARRICWGKFFNAGQTCIGVDYVLAVDGVEAPFIEAVKKTIKQFYGENPRVSDAFPRIISEQHAKRLTDLFKQGKVVAGGDSDPKEKYVAPTVMLYVEMNGTLMSDEIFGPVMPIIRVKTMDEAIAFINQRPTPLALYLFSNNPTNQDKVLQNTRSGACSLNEVLLHFANSKLPFGGCGESGVGSYHGKRTFEVFTHERAVIKSTNRNWLDVPVRYPPYTGTKFFLADTITKIGW
jgi:acyl-CoA reductase-like NAD-dependent aldehyde dehydrogenase